MLWFWRPPVSVFYVDTPQPHHSSADGSRRTRRCRPPPPDAVTQTAIDVMALARAINFEIVPAHGVQGFGRWAKGAARRQGSDADTIRSELARAGIEATIPAKSSRRIRSLIILKDIPGATSSSAYSRSS